VREGVVFELTEHKAAAAVVESLGHVVADETGAGVAVDGEPQHSWIGVSPATAIARLAPLAVEEPEAVLRRQDRRPRSAGGGR